MYLFKMDHRKGTRREEDRRHCKSYKLGPLHSCFQVVGVISKVVTRNRILRNSQGRAALLHPCMETASLSTRENISRNRVSATIKCRQHQMVCPVNHLVHEGHIRWRLKFAVLPRCAHVFDQLTPGHGRRHARGPQETTICSEELSSDSCHGPFGLRPENFTCCLVDY